MASSGGSLNSFHYNPTLSSFPTSQYMNNSFTDLLSSNNKDNYEEKSTFNWGAESLPLSPLPLSPSFFLDSPAIFGSSNVLPSPTTGAFAALYSKEEGTTFPDFSFHSQTRPSNSSAPALTTSKDSLKRQREDENTVVKSEEGPTHNVREQGKSDDGYNWRKYGQKQVKGSENPRSYFKCTFPNCPTKKKVERNLEGYITEIVYKGSHTHAKPQSTRRSSSNNHVPCNQNQNPPLFLESTTTDHSSVSVSVSLGDDDIEQASSMTNSTDDNGNDHDAKRWKGDDENESVAASGSRTVREPRVVVQTTSEIDILDDGYRWRKYGQKVVKGNPNPRSYYKCTSNGCPVRKHVERAFHDSRAVITTYEGKHNHEVPAARGSGCYAASRPQAAMRPPVVSSHSNGANLTNTTTWTNQAPYAPDMAQNAENFAFSGFGLSYANQMHQTESFMSAAKEEPRDHSFFDLF